MTYENDNGNTFPMSMVESIMGNFQKCLDHLRLHLSKAGISNWVILSLCQLFFGVVVVVVVVCLFVYYFVSWLSTLLAASFQFSKCCSPFSIF